MRTIHLTKKKNQNKAIWNALFILSVIVVLQVIKCRIDEYAIIAYYITVIKNWKPLEFE